VGALVDVARAGELMRRQRTRGSLQVRGGQTVRSSGGGAGELYTLNCNY